MAAPWAGLSSFPLRQGKFGVLIHLLPGGGTELHYSIKIQGYGLCSEGRWSCSKRRRLSCGQGLHAHTGQREADEKREHHEQFSSPYSLRRLVIVNTREGEKRVQRSVGLQREQWALGWKLRRSRELNQMPVPSLCWKRFWELCFSLLLLMIFTRLHCFNLASCC